MSELHDSGSACADGRPSDITSDNTQLSILKQVGIPAVPAASGELARRDCATPTLPAGLDVARYIAAATSPATRRAYQGDVSDFEAWGGRIPSSAEAIAAYAVNRAQIHCIATLTRRLVGIGRAHASQGLNDPTKSDLVRTVIRGLRRLHGLPQRQASPLLRDDLFPVLAQMSGLKGLRDRALLLLGFATALRRAELVSLDVGHIEQVGEGLVVHVPRSKVDQFGVGRKIAVPHGRTAACPVLALAGWLNAARISEGPLFRAVTKGGAVSASRLSDQAVSLIVKARVAPIGLPASTFSGHSLRAGLVTSAAKAGVSLTKIQEQSGHRSIAMLARYIRDAKAFEGNASGLLL